MCQLKILGLILVHGIETNHNKLANSHFLFHETLQRSKGYFLLLIYIICFIVCAILTSTLLGHVWHDNNLFMLTLALDIFINTVP
jgi:hypothetical protein